MIVSTNVIESETTLERDPKTGSYYHTSLWINGTMYMADHADVQQATAWIIRKTDSVLSAQAPAHEAQPTFDTSCCSYKCGNPADCKAQRCRCCNAIMGDSDHCPDCGCEEYEETCR
jgi:hypothetical protein